MTRWDGYDAAGNRTRITHPGGQAFTYAYDAAGRLTGLYEGADTSAPLGAFEYDARGSPDLRSERYGSGVDYRYDAIDAF